jgi:HNH endonuclease
MSGPEEAARFDAHVDRSGEHHIWLGSRNPQRGTGKLKVDGKQVTAHRRAWELANGTLPAGAVVQPCPDQPLCVRVEHLRLGKAASTTPQPGPRRGSKRVQVQVNGLRVHRRVRGGRGDVKSTKALIREQL